MTRKTREKGRKKSLLHGSKLLAPFSAYLTAAPKSGPLVGDGAPGFQRMRPEQWATSDVSKDDYLA